MVTAATVRDDCKSYFNPFKGPIPLVILKFASYGTIVIPIIMSGILLVSTILAGRAKPVQESNVNKDTTDKVNVHNPARIEDAPAKKSENRSPLKLTVALRDKVEGKGLMLKHQAIRDDYGVANILQSNDLVTGVYDIHLSSNVAVIKFEHLTSLQETIKRDIVEKMDKHVETTHLKVEEDEPRVEVLDDHEEGIKEEILTVSEESKSKFAKEIAQFVSEEYSTLTKNEDTSRISWRDGKVLDGYTYEILGRVKRSFPPYATQAVYIEIDIKIKVAFFKSK